MSAPFVLLVRLRGASSSQVYTFDQPRIAIGRDAANDLVLANGRRAVSRRHAELWRVRGRLHLVDLGSKNATLLDGDALTPGRPAALAPGHRFIIGDFVLEVAKPNPDGAAGSVHTLDSGRISSGPV